MYKVHQMSLVVLGFTQRSHLLVYYFIRSFVVLDNRGGLLI